MPRDRCVAGRIAESAESAAAFVPPTSTWWNTASSSSHHTSLTELICQSVVDDSSVRVDWLGLSSLLDTHNIDFESPGVSLCVQRRLIDAVDPTDCCARAITKLLAIGVFRESLQNALIVRLRELHPSLDTTWLHDAANPSETLLIDALLPHLSDSTTDDSALRAVLSHRFTPDVLRRELCRLDDAQSVVLCQRLGQILLRDDHASSNLVPVAIEWCKALVDTAGRRAMLDPNGQLAVQLAQLADIVSILMDLCTSYCELSTVCDTADHAAADVFVPSSEDYVIETLIL